MVPNTRATACRRWPPFEGLRLSPLWTRCLFVHAPENHWRLSSPGSARLRYTAGTLEESRRSSRGLRLPLSRGWTPGFRTRDRCTRWFWVVAPLHEPPRFVIGTNPPFRSRLFSPPPEFPPRGYVKNLPNTRSAFSERMPCTSAVGRPALPISLMYLAQETSG